MKHDFKGYPSSDYRFFAFDPNGDGVVFFRTEKDRDIYVEEMIDYYRDEDGWSDDVTSVCVGVVTGVATAIDVQHKPPAEELDEDGLDHEGTYWGDFDTICRYAIRPVSGPTPATRELASSIRRNLRHLASAVHAPGLPDPSAMLDYINHMDTLAEQIESEPDALVSAATDGVMQPHVRGAVERAIRRLEFDMERMQKEDPTNYDIMFPEGDRDSLRELLNAAQLSDEKKSGAMNPWRGAGPDPRGGSNAAG